MAVSFVSAGTGYVATSPVQSWAMGAPSSIAVNNLLLAVVIEDDNLTITTSGPAGWSTFYNNAAAKYNISVFYKVAVAGDVGAGSYTFTNNGTVGSTAYPAGGIVQYAGVNTSSPFDGTGLLNENSAGTTMTCPSVTPTLVGDMLCLLYGNYAPYNITAGPTGPTQRIAEWASGLAAAWLYDEPLTTTSATSAYSATISSSDSAPFGFSFLLAPAVAAVPRSALGLVTTQAVKRASYYHHRPANHDRLTIGD